MITAVILAAGQSKRMGQSKILLPWGPVTVLEQVITIINSAGVENIIVVTGKDRQKIKALVNNTARTVFNREFSRYEMLHSLQIGLAEVLPGTHAVIVALGDQPQIQSRTIRLVVEAYKTKRATIIVPSFKMRRGHPWLIDKSHWDEIQRMDPSESMRDFLKRHKREIHYITIDNDSILKDLDTPEDYLKSKP